MLIKEKAIQCGTYYLEISFKLAGGTSKADGLNKFSNIPNYADNVLAAEACLQALPAGGDPMTCLNQIHKFMLPMAAPEYPIQVCPLTVRDNPGGGFEISEWVTLPSASEEVEAEITLSMRSSLPLELWGDLSVYARHVEPARYSIQLSLKDDEPARLSFPPLTVPPAFLISVHGFATRFVGPGILRANATITWVPARADR